MASSCSNSCSRPVLQLQGCRTPGHFSGQDHSIWMIFDYWCCTAPTSKISSQPLSFFFASGFYWYITLQSPGLVFLQWNFPLHSPRVHRLPRISGRSDWYPTCATLLNQSQTLRPLYFVHMPLAFWILWCFGARCVMRNSRVCDRVL